jgi:hypothetical protein
MYSFDVLDVNSDMDIFLKGKKTLKPIKKNERADFFCNYGNSKIKVTYPNLCGISVRNNNNLLPKNSIAFLSYEQNSVRGNGESVYIQSGVGHRNRGVYINVENFLDVCSVFTSKRLIDGDWVNWYDEYTKPNTNHFKYEKFKYDSIIYSLFNVKSYQSSLRQIEYKNNYWDIKNEFFWVSKNRMKELSNIHGYDNLYNDVRTSNDRYVYKILFGDERVYDQISDDAKKVLDIATKLVEDSIQIRSLISNDENHLDSWDAGYTQLKPLWAEYFQKEFEEFRRLYKKFEDRMRPLVYELGFLNL